MRTSQASAMNGDGVAGAEPLRQMVSFLMAAKPT